MGSRNGDMLITVVTVCLNAERLIGKTMKSVLRQTYGNIEYIIKDGCSADATNEIAESYRDKFERRGVRLVHISQKDAGIYDAMNYAVEKAQGQYVYFLNAGDCLVNRDVLKKTESFLSRTGADVAYGDVMQEGGGGRRIRRYRGVCSRKAYFLSGDCICHQAMFARRELLTGKKFDLSYKVCADKEWQLAQIAAGRSFRPMGFAVASVLLGGFSASNIPELEKETRRCVYKYIRGMAWVYDIVSRLKHNAVAVMVLRVAGDAFFASKRLKLEK